MRKRSTGFSKIPPFTAGWTGAVAAETAAALLLYAGPGLVRSLTAVLAMEAGALAVGLWTAPNDEEALRRRWLLGLAAFVVAALYAGAWSLLPGTGERALGQGLGLALLAALPLYAVGSVVGGIAAVDGPGEGAGGPGAAALAGAFVGFLVTGYALPRALAPASLYLGCVVLLSAGGLIWGGRADGWVRRRVRRVASSARGPVRLEERRLARAGLAGCVLEEGACVRGFWWEGVTDQRPWEVHLLRAWARRPARGRALLLGGLPALAAGDLVGGRLSAGPVERASAEDPAGGTGGRPRPEVREEAAGGDAAGIRARPTVEVRDENPAGEPAQPGARPHIDVWEENPAVCAVLERSAGSRLSLGGEDLTLQILGGNLEDLLEQRRGRYDLVLVNTSALAAAGPHRVSRRLRTLLVESLANGGILGVGPDPASPGLLASEEGAPVGWSTAKLSRRLDPSPESLEVDWFETETVWLAWRDGGGRAPGIVPAWIRDVEGFAP